MRAKQAKILIDFWITGYVYNNEHLVSYNICSFTWDLCSLPHWVSSLFNVNFILFYTLLGFEHKGSKGEVIKDYLKILNLKIMLFSVITLSQMDWAQDNFSNSKLAKSRHLCRSFEISVTEEMDWCCVCVCVHMHPPVWFRKAGTEGFFLPLSSLIKISLHLLLGIFTDTINV